MTVTLATPSPASLYASVCPGTREDETGLIFGRIRDVDDASALADANVGTRWTEFTWSASRRERHRVGAMARSNGSGLYVLCGVPLDVPLNLQARFGNQAAGPVLVTVDRRLVTRVDLAVSRTDTASRFVAPDDTTEATFSLFGSSALTGLVRDGAGRAVPNASIMISGTARVARTDSSGAFHVNGIPAGTRTVEFRAIGAEPTEAIIDFRSRARVDTTFIMNRTAQALAPVRVQVAPRRRTTPDLEAYELRRLRGWGSYLTDEQIGKLTLPDLTAALAQIPGVHIEYGTSGTPTPMLFGTRSGKCIPNFFLDGAPFVVDRDHQFADLSAMIRPDNIRAIEVYKTPGFIPPQFDLMSSTACGSVVIWTK